jgi:hypothetical protein
MIRQEAWISMATPNSETADRFVFKLRVHGFHHESLGQREVYDDVFVRIPYQSARILCGGRDPSDDHPNVEMRATYMAIDTLERSRFAKPDLRSGPWTIHKTEIQPVPKGGIPSSAIYEWTDDDGTKGFVV